MAGTGLHSELHDSLETMKSWTYQINVLHQKYELNENTNPAAGSKHVGGYANPSDEIFSENNENFILHDTKPQAISKQKHQHKELRQREKSHKWIFQHHGTCDLQKEINDIFSYSPQERKVLPRLFIQKPNLKNDDGISFFISFQPNKQNLNFWASQTQTAAWFTVCWENIVFVIFCHHFVLKILRRQFRTYNWKDFCEASCFKFFSKTWHWLERKHKVNEHIECKYFFFARNCQ